MVHIHERLKHERLRISLSQEEFARACGVSKRAQASYESGERSPRAEYLEAASSVGVDVQYVLTGIRAGGESASAIPFAPSRASAGTGVPLYDVEGAAGAGRSLENESVVGTFTIDFETLTQMGLVGARLAGIRVRGDSMEPTLFDDDWVFIDLNDTNFAQAGVFLVWVSGELRIKRLQRLAGGAMLLISDNSYYEKEMIAPDRMQEVHVMGRVRTRMGRLLDLEIPRICR
ncbi:XRE family transcriptional regulator [Salinicola acroporae]|uniref:HTH cro/C1-type domain-containing protein n=1 Tax=Salinicola acroporae TaxID=1541440 RepID=A0ABT6I0X0_9GAMM|nr:S24 family peptidase [Salinicola acroporae]MDH4571123.1 hypothetical protein [Salinicola acroporae]